MTYFHNVQRGATLIELSLVVVVITMIVFGAGIYYQTVHQNARVAESVTTIKSVTQASYQWVLGETDFSGISMQALVEDSQLLSPAHNFNPWKGRVSVAPASNPHNIKICLEQVPSNACEKLAQNLQAVAIERPNCAGKQFCGIF